MMKSLSVIGTAAMFMVGGSILSHGVPALHHFSQHVVELVVQAITADGAMAVLASVVAVLLPILIDAIIGILAGALVLLLVTGVTKAWQAVRHSN